MRNENNPKSPLTLVAFKVHISMKNFYTISLLSQKNKLKCNMKNTCIQKNSILTNKINK